MKTAFDSASSHEAARILLSLSGLKGMSNRKALELFRAEAGTLGSVDSHELFLSLARNLPDPADGHEEAWDKSARWLTEGEATNIQAVPFCDDRYPRRLLAISDPPVVLFVKGRIEALHGTAVVAIVGTRSPTHFGEGEAKKAGKAAAESDAVVVSGLALGCDAKAHEGCLGAGGTAVAVLAHGLDKVYPAANRHLAEWILDSGGCLVSERPVGVKPARWAFAHRDRIQSGLSDGVLVIETDVKGGTMHTVEFARKQRRSLACIDHPPQFRSESQAQGNRRLIEKREAVPISDQNSFSQFLHGLHTAQLEKAEPQPKPREGQLSMGI